MLDLNVHLLLGNGAAADRDTRLAGEVVDDPLRGVLDGVVVGGLQAGDEVSGAPVAGDVPTPHGRDARVAPQLGRQLGDTGAIPNQQHHSGLAIAGVLKAVVGDHALGVRVLGAVGVEPVGDPRPEGTRHDEEDGSEREHQAGAAVGETCEAVHHRRSRSASRAHQPAIHSLDSMP